MNIEVHEEVQDEVQSLNFIERTKDRYKKVFDPEEIKYSNRRK